MEELVRPAIKGIKDYIPGKNPKRPGIIKLASNENPFGPSPKALAAIKNEAKALQVYPDQKSTRLREALAKKLRLEADNFIVGNGSDEIMQIAAATFLKPGEEVLVSENSFSVYEFTARLLDGRPVFVELHNYRQDLAGLANYISRSTKIIYLCNPHNPTGTVFGATELSLFMKKVPDNVLVVIDEAYLEFASAKDLPDSLEYVKAGKKVLVLRTFSKFYGLAGLRVGYGIAPKDIISYMFRAKLPFNVNRLAQAGALAALGDKPFLKKTLSNNAAGKKYLYAQLDKLGLEYLRTESNFIFINLKRPADPLFLDMMRQGVIVRPLTSFGFPEAIRVSIGTPEHNRKFITVLAKTLPGAEC